ncbi:hypothetical protein C7M84_019635 [Penaeus vannamei]|uniref:Uncharacterized protein n=1 Tax=Penaeus vannamei TaxID=6689 RepID=A0A423SEC4_PENVA|nr:hypothetical protein C7M84_019635 [Penaeus vannamei]
MHYLVHFRDSKGSLFLASPFAHLVVRRLHRAPSPPLHAAHSMTLNSFPVFSLDLLTLKLIEIEELRPHDLAEKNHERGTSPRTQEKRGVVSERLQQYLHFTEEQASRLPQEESGRTRPVAFLQSWICLLGDRSFLLILAGQRRPRIRHPPWHRSFVCSAPPEGTPFPFLSPSSASSSLPLRTRRRSLGSCAQPVLSLALLLPPAAPSAGSRSPSLPPFFSHSMESSSADPSQSFIFFRSFFFVAQICSEASPLLPRAVSSRRRASRRRPLLPEPKAASSPRTFTRWRPRNAFLSRHACHGNPRSSCHDTIARELPAKARGSSQPLTQTEAPRSRPGIPGFHTHSLISKIKLVLQIPQITFTTADYVVPRPLSSRSLFTSSGG